MTKKIKRQHSGSGQYQKSKHLSKAVQQALTFHQSGHLAEAEKLYKQVLSVEPNQPDALLYMGILSQQLGKSEIAVQLIRKSLTYKPDNILALNNLGNALQCLNELEEAASCFRRALSFKPDYIEVHYNLGVVMQKLGRFDEAILSYERALTFRPDYAEAHYNLAFILRRQKKTREAIDRFRRAIASRPNFPPAHYNLGVLLQELGDLDEAIDCYRRALNLTPNYAEAHNNLGIALGKQGKPDEAIRCFHAALLLNPDYVEARCNLGSALKDQGNLKEAIAALESALRLEPEDLTVRDNQLLCLNYSDQHTLAEYRDAVRLYGHYASQRAKTPYKAWTVPAQPKRLRIGLVSGDLRNHSVGFFLEGILCELTQGDLEIIAYPTYVKEDELTERIRPFFADWRPIPSSGISDEEAAGIIHDDGIQILIDLSGHTSHNRLPVFAWRPAPVQVSWLGYSASTGLVEMDYLIADPYVAPPDEEAQFVETIWRLPESFLCFSPPRTAMRLAPLPALTSGCITFGCFNNLSKMNDSVVALWARVLQAVPEARLFLKAKPFADPALCATTRSRFAVFGIAPERLLFQGYAASREEHLAAYNKVDIALDPFPYNGTTTTVEGLWMGVPFITLRGDRFIAHVGESIANNVGLFDWVAADQEDYVAKAAARAADLQALTHLRSGLRAQLLASPVLDSQRFARHFTEALWEMWRRFKS